MIHALHEARRALEARGQEIVIQIATPSIVLRTLVLTGLTDGVAIVCDRDEAVRVATRKAGS